ncbi:radical SAM/SPASM domain-containing protein [Tepidibacter mesophilus]|uniref:radical SAM/SPASM domain-containing protein n=1 Tax=Tepidibacter mesophilus TaxID=655607 RepID=UPI0016518038|nr:radical SAM protein [Tepidibacter mesophilus]
MKYSLNENVKSITKEDNILLYNPVKSSWIKTKQKNVDKLQRLINSDLKTLNKEDRYLLDYLERYDIISDLDNKTDIEADSPISIYFFLTKKCNLECSFCSMNSNPNIDSSNNLSFDEIKEFIDQLSDFNIKRIILTGGEPLLHDKLIKIIEYIKEKLGTKVIVSTNGFLLSEQFCKDIKGKVDRIDISWESIYGEYKEMRDQFIKNIDVAKKNKINMNFSYVVTKNNREYIYEYIDYCVLYDAGIDLKIVSPINNGNDYDDLILQEEDVLDLYESVFEYIIEKNYVNSPCLKSIIGYTPKPKLGCSGYYKNMFAIYPNGDVFPCHSVNSSEYSLTNIKENSFEDCVKLFGKKRNTFSVFNIDDREYCKECDIRNFCLGVCAGEIYKDIESGSIKPSTCKFRSIIVNYFLWEHKKNISFKEQLNNIILKIREAKSCVKL